MTTHHLNGITTEKDVVFGKGGNRDLRCDIYRPASSEKRTAVIQIHGGAFRVGAKERVEEKSIYFTSRGYVSIATQYRLFPEATWPNCLEDIKACIRWTRANAEYLGIDPSRIAVAGYSAGAHLALTSAGTANRPEYEGQGGNPGVGTELAACFAYYSPAEIFLRADGAKHPLMPDGWDQYEYPEASAMTYVGPHFPPTVLFHGTVDAVIPMESSFRLFNALRAANVPAELHAIAGVCHEFDQYPEFGEPCAELCDVFFHRYVLHPRVYPPFQPSSPVP